jgi:hypothetical protein
MGNAQKHQTVNLTQVLKIMIMQNELARKKLRETISNCNTYIQDQFGLLVIAILLVIRTCIVQTSVDEAIVIW